MNNNFKYPLISIIIVTLNAQRTIKECLRLIKNQNYSSISEVLIVDGGSTDETLEICKNSGLPVKIINGGFRDNQEARRSVGVLKAKNEICAFIDSDNYILDKNWFSEMIKPLLEDEEIVATQTLRYAVPKNSSILNRYFGLMGGADPVSYYLGKSDRLSWISDKWNLLGKVVNENKNYIKVKFDPDNYPTVGCNGVLFRKSILLKSNWGKPENFFHTDIFVDIGRLGYNTFGIVKNEIFHNTAGTPLSFLSKRRKYMQLHHQMLSRNRRQLVFDSTKSKDVIKLLIYIIFTLTFVEPLLESVKGYTRKKDVAWFLHPVMTLGMAILYTEATLNTFVHKYTKND